MRDKNRHYPPHEYSQREKKYVFPGPRITMTRSVVVSLILIISMYFGMIPRELAVNDFGGRFIVDISQFVFYISLIYSLYLCFWVYLCILIIQKNLKHLMVLEEPEENMSMSPRQFRKFMR